MRVKSMTAWMLVMILGICTLTACGGEEAAEVEEKETKVESSADVQAFAGSNWQIWNDSWTEETASGGAVNVKINGYIRIPEFEHMSAVEVRRYEFSQENKKNLLEGIFGSEIYYGSKDKMPKSVIRQYIKEAEELIRDTKDAIKNIEKKKEADWKESLKEEKENLRFLERDKAESEKMLEKAPDDFVKIKEGDYNEPYYIGKLNGILYSVLYEDETSNDEESEVAQQNGRNFIDPREYGTISIAPLNTSDLAPEDVKGENVYWTPVETGESANQCTLKKEDAEQMALDFLAKAGFRQTGQGDVQPLVSKEAGCLSWSDGNSGKVSYNGWNFEFGPGINDMMFRDFGCDSSYVLYYDGDAQGDEYRYDGYSMDCKTAVDVTDAGIVYAKWSNPVDIVSAAQNVKLISPETAMDIMKSNMNEYASFAWEKGQSRMNFNRLMLTYYRVSDPDDRKLFTYIPAWCLLGDTGNVFVINAMDGSVINDWASTWGVYMLNDLETGQTY